MKSMDTFVGSAEKHVNVNLVSHLTLGSLK